MEIKVGSAGWSYDDWKDPFYPSSLKRSQWLSYYAKYFDFVEVNTSFYHLPRSTTLEGWNDQTPHDFEFSFKLWQKLTHKYHDVDVEDTMAAFHSALRPLSHKVTTILIQFPPFFKHGDNTEKHLKSLLNHLDPGYSYAVEFRDSSWLKDDVLSRLFSDPNVLVASSYLDYLDPYYYYPKQNKYYVRMMGDRTLQNFSRTQRGQKEAMDALVKKVRQFSQKTAITDFFVIFNNHFRGFSPADINEFKKRLSLPLKEFKKNKSLLDFV